MTTSQSISDAIAAENRLREWFRNNRRFVEIDTPLNIVRDQSDFWTFENGANTYVVYPSGKMEQNGDDQNPFYI